jgi:hypothetical protein
MRLIPTARKEKLPHGFSYPLGAERISEALAGIPQFETMELWFAWRDEFWSSRWRRRIIDRGVVTLLEISFWEYFGRWHVGVYSVPSEYVCVARERLESELVRVRERLMVARSAARIRVTLDLAAVGPAGNQAVHRTAPPPSAPTRARYYGSRGLRPGRAAGGGR